MFSCNICDKVFTLKCNMLRHAKSHEQMKFQCSHCKQDFNRRDHLVNHVQKKHGFIKYSAEYNLAMGSTIRQPLSGSTPHTSKAPNQPTPKGPSTHSSTGKRENKNAQHNKIKLKKTRMGLGNIPGFNEIDSSLDRTTVWYYRSNVENMIAYQTFLDSLKPELIRKLNNFVCIKPIKYNLKLEATYSHKELPSENRSFKTSARELFSYSDISTLVDDDFAILLSEEDAYMRKGSGFTLSSIDGILLGVYEYTPMGGSSYIPLPESISNKKGVINPQNIDEYCFKWAILARHASGNNRFKVDINYFNEEHRYDFSGLSFPTPISEIPIFEKRNNDTTVNVYGLKFVKSEMKHVVYPLRIVDSEKSNHFDLLVLECGEKSHYTYISNFSRLVRKQKTLHKGRLFICKRCFTGFDEQIKKSRLSGKAALEQHMQICGVNKPIFPILPPEGSTLKFKAWEKAQRVPFVIYADFEALLEENTEHLGMNTKGVHTHTPMSYGFFVKASDDIPLDLLERYNIPQTPVIFRGSESQNSVAKNFVTSLVTIADRLSKLLKSTNVPIVMTEEQRLIHNVKTECDFCKTSFGGKILKVADHNHLTGLFRHTLCTKCNLNLKTVDFVPCFMHNLSAYDAHFIVTELGYDTNKISLIPNTEENYISFSKRVNDDFTIRFLDSCRFMASSLESLAKNLTTSELEKFRETAKVFQPMDMPLVTRKGVFPYEYCDKWSKLEESSLPSKFDFYSALTETHVSEEDYCHAIKVWDHFNCTSLGGYSDLYLKIDVLLLADIFENFRDICMKTYNLDPAYYFTAPGFSFDCMLKYTSISLELLTDYDMILMMEDGIRGGLVQASERYCKANNPKTEGYDSGAPPSWLVYQDCNNLYGWAMSQYMPYGGFKWWDGDMDQALKLLDDMNETSEMGCVFDVDISYPDSLHEKHNDLPFLPRSNTPPGSKVCKLMATLEGKQRYIIHYLNLKQAIENGLIVDKVHRVLEFKQSPWLAQYINLNTEMRKMATNNFEKEFYKLMNNAVFGKTMECVRRRIDLRLVSSPKIMRKLINRNTFKHCIQYNRNLTAVSLEKKVIKFDKPIYIGFAVLDISKTLMYDYHYNVMQRYYNDRIRLMYTDTDSLVYRVTTEDFYKDLIENPILLNRMDTSNLPQDHPCYVGSRARIPGLFKDETEGRVMSEFIALRAKSYSYKIGGREAIVAKGIRGHVVRNHLTFEDHKRCLFENDDDDDVNDGDKDKVNEVYNDDDDDDDFGGDGDDVEWKDREMKRCALSGFQSTIKAIHQNATTTIDDSTIQPPPYTPYTPYRVNMSIRSFKHQVKTIKSLKISLNRFDDKRVVGEDRIHTLAYGHYKLRV